MTDTAYCVTRWNLYRLWCNSIRLININPQAKKEIDAARAALEAHHRSCPVCQEHMHEMTEKARIAVHPEFEE